MYIIPTSGAEHLVRGLDGQEGIQVILPGKNKEAARLFPDGEIYMRLAEAADLQGRVVVLHCGQPDPNAGLIELEILLEILRRAGVSQREVFFSYFPYGMQDKVFRVGEINAAEALLRKLGAYYGVQQVYALDPHFQSKDWLRDHAFTAVSAVPLLKAAALKDHPDMIFVAPDAGSQARTSHAGLTKTRTDSYNVEHQHDDAFAAMVQGRHVGVIDDVVETGGTMARFAEKCREYQAKSVSALITHGILASGLERLRAAYDRFYLTNSVDRPEANVDVGGLIRQVLTGNMGVL